MKEVRSLSSEQREMTTEDVIGLTDCPVCDTEVLVMNDHGNEGISADHYIQDHHHRQTGDLCNASSKRLRDLA